jgi:hypothetical protein
MQEVAIASFNLYYSWKTSSQAPAYASNTELFVSITIVGLISNKCKPTECLESPLTRIFYLKITLMNFLKNWSPSYVTLVHILRKSQRETYYKTVIKPALLYGSAIWTSSNKQHLNNLFKCQKRAARIILDKDRDAPSIDQCLNL